MTESKKKMYLTCLDCGKVINGGAHLSRHVRENHNYSSYDDYKIKHDLIKPFEQIQKKLKDEGAICCGICGLYAHDLKSHVIRTHKMCVKDYKEKYGNLSSKKYRLNLSEKIKGDKNPGYNHGGKFSPFSDKFIHANKIDKKEIFDRVRNSIKNNGNHSNTIKYWLKRGYTEEEARKNISERQRTFTLEKCIEKYGEEDGRKKWLDRQEKWQNSCKKSMKNRFSKISQELFWCVYKNITNESEFIYFAELSENKDLDSSGLNNEYKLKISGRLLLPDFINTKNRKIIEFDGTYWHGEKNLKKIANTNRLRDHERDEILISNGYVVLHIKEEEYRKNKQEIINRCLEFLNE